jgi:putative tricarboxylic transport membrane protein
LSIVGSFITGITDVANLECLTTAFFGVFLGIIIGALPGLTATTGVAIFLPMTFFMEAIPSFAFLLGIYCGGIYGGSITAILINTPGTPAAAATSMEGFPLAKKGDALKALEMALYASVVSGIISCICLVFVSPILARMALKFGPAEYFALGLLGLSIVAGLSTGNIVKGLIATCFGMFLSFIGLDPINGALRLTFGTYIMQNGITLIPALIALFAVSELLVQAEDRFKGIKEEKFEVRGKHLSFREFAEQWRHIIKSSLIGCFIGAVPATGSSVSAFLSYNEARRSAKHPEMFGKGSLEGIAAAEAGNNGVTGSTLIPTLTLGIPGDSVTAVLLGALMIQGLTPGPLLFQNEARTIYAIYGILFISNFIMLFQGIIGINFFHRVTLIPKSILQPIILALCCIGTFASATRQYELIVMTVIGTIAYFMVKAKIPLSPTLLAIILGPTIEANFRRGMMVSRGSFMKFASRPITATILAVTVFLLALSFYNEIRLSKKHN